jgi:hypothetical protein
MTTARVTKQDLDLISDLIFDSFITDDLEFQNVHFVFRSLTTEERLDIARRYKYATAKENIDLMINILSFSISYIEGQEIENKLLSERLLRLNSKIIFKFYDFYQKLEDKISNAAKFVDYFVETKESRNNWAIFKTCYRSEDPFFVRKLNQYRYYWMLMNVFRDSLENEKRTWRKVEYATNSICAFVNPKAYNKTRHDMGVADQLENQEDIEKQEFVEQIEQGKEGVETQVTNDITQEIFTTMNKLPNETPEEHAVRMNTVMERFLAGQITDEHDRLVREDEIKIFKMHLLEKRKKVLVERTLHEERQMRFDSTEVLDNPVAKAALEEDAKLGFFHEGISYLDIMRKKDFAAIPRKEKQKAFDEVMLEQIDVKKDVESFLKGLSDQIKSEGHEQPQELPLNGSIEPTMENASEPPADSSNNEKPIMNAAQRAANMKIDVNSIDLIKQRDEKMKRIGRSLQNRNQALERNDIPKKENDQGLDVMKFTD